MHYVPQFSLLRNWWQLFPWSFNYPQVCQRGIPFNFEIFTLIFSLVPCLRSIIIFYFQIGFEI